MALAGRKKTGAQGAIASPRNVKTAADATGVGRKPTARKSDPTQPRQSRKSSLLSVILADTSLDPAAVKRIKGAHGAGLDVADLAAFVTYQIEIVRQAYASGQLAAKDLIVGLNKIGSQVAAAAQLGTAGGTGGANVNVTFNGVGPTSTRPEAAQIVTQFDPDVGDTIPTE